MKTPLLGKSAGFLTLLLVCGTQAGDGNNNPGGHDDEHVIVKPTNLKWGPPPPVLPPGAQFAVLVGDPTKAGAAYTIRAKFPDGYQLPPHLHPVDENVTVIQGALLVGRGEKFDLQKVEELPAGSYMRMPKNLRHFAAAKGETIIQVHGIGPFEFNYVNAADDPRKKK
jgi:quercetin dioxygenase-like cupin family protein